MGGVNVLGGLHRILVLVGNLVDGPVKSGSEMAVVVVLRIKVYSRFIQMLGSSASDVRTTLGSRIVDPTEIL